jgi:hypothetical protein
VEQERRVLMLWTAISDLAPPDENPMRWAVGRTSMPFRRVDWARRVRNRVAHPDGNPINPRDVARAGDIFEDLLRRLGMTLPDEVSAPPAEQSVTEAAGNASPAREPAEVDSASVGRGSSAPAAQRGPRRPGVTLTGRRMPMPTILLLVVGIGCTLSLWLVLAGLPALVLASIAMSKVYTDYSGAQRLTRTGWIAFTILFMITLAGLALRYVTHSTYTV